MKQPALRFKRSNDGEFPDWECKKIKDIASKMKAGGTPKANVRSYYDGDIPFLGISDISKSGKYVSDTMKCISPEGLQSSSAWIVPAGTLILSMYASYGKPCISKVDLATSQALIAIELKDDYSVEFIYQVFSKFLNSGFWNKYVKTGAQPNLSKSVIESTDIYSPCLEEQQKIAFFFSTLDQKIELNERKLEALEKLKKGLMQKIFSREIRFKQENGSDFPKWNNKRLGEVACLNNGRAYKQEELLNEGKYVVLRVGNFFTNEKYYYSNMELESCKYAHKGDLLYCWSASFGPKIWDGEKVIYHYHIWKIDPINIDRNYLYYYLQRDVVNLEQEMNGGTMMHLTKANMELRSVEIPVIEEQTKIASLFIHFDKKIELVLAKINSLKKLKQGFMQQMFV